MGQCRHSERNGVECGNPIIILLLVFLFLSSCHRTHDPLIGRWTVERVNVEFNERSATPEMVRQYGELEKGNIIEITKDSVLTFISGGDTLRGRCSLREQRLYCDGKPFGKLEDGLLTTETPTPLGKVTVSYRK